MKKLVLTFTLSIFLTLCNAHEKSDLIKFKPNISFSNFTVKVEKTKVKPNLKSHQLGHKFRTRIKEEFENQKSLFAGHYTLATWGCGSPCQMSVLVDRKTGKIYDAPTASVGYKFQKDSRMLIINPPDSLGYYIKDCPYCIPEIYILNEETKKFEKIKP